MWSAATVLVCALDMLGRSAATFPPIALLTERPSDVSRVAEAFTRTGVSVIYVLVRLGAHPDSLLYATVTRSMRIVLAAQSSSSSR